MTAHISPAGTGRNSHLTPYPENVPNRLQYPECGAWSLLARAAEAMPGRLACHYHESRWTWEELQVDAQRAATMLQRAGVRPGDRVGVLLPNIPEYIIVLNGIWRLGAIAVSLSPMEVAEEIDRQIETTECRVVVCLDMLAGLLSGQHRPDLVLFISLRPQLSPFEQLGYLYLRKRRTGHWWLSASDHVRWFWDEMKSCAPSQVTAEIDPRAAPALILPTGGTTGVPQAVTLSHRNLVANAIQQFAWAGGVPGKETLLAVLPFFHCYGLSTNVLGGAAMIASLIIHHRFSVRQTIRSIERHRPTVFHAVPAMLAAMNDYLRDHPANLRSLKWVISGGASLPESIGREFADHSGALVVEGYGLSEASPVTHVGPLNDDAEFGTIGLPLPDTDCRIVDAETGTRDVSEGDVGELLVRGPQVMLGYWNDPARTAGVICDGWLSTGDLVRRCPNGLYQVVDRKKDMIITSGLNVYPVEVEAVLKRHPSIRDAAVIGVPDAQRGELVKAFVVLRDGAAWDERDLRSFCEEHLATYRRPRLFERVAGELPRNFLGKVLRKSLREAVGNG